MLCIFILSFLRYKSDYQMLERRRGRMERGSEREREREVGSRRMHLAPYPSFL